jgi:hypothetical protein
VMLAFLGFSLAVIAAYEYGGLGLREATVPHTGWVPTGPYLSCIFFAVVALWSGSRPFRRGVMAMLALQVLFGLEEWIRRWPHPSANPYLHISTWRPLWTVATPLAWAAMLLLGERRPAPREGREAAEQADAADEAQGGTRTSLQGAALCPRRADGRGHRFAADRQCSMDMRGSGGSDGSCSSGARSTG